MPEPAASYALGQRVDSFDHALDAFLWRPVGRLNVGRLRSAAVQLCRAHGHAVSGMSTGAAGTIGTVTVVTSSFGGWFAGALADRFGRVPHAADRDPVVRGRA
jgi:MFS family permease